MKTLYKLLLACAFVIPIAALAQINSPVTILKKNFGGSLADSTCSMVPMSDGGCVIAGKIGAADGNVTCTGNVLMRLDSIGNIIWRNCYPWQAVSIEKTPDGGFIAAGSTTSPTVPGYRGGSDVLVTKLDNIGQVQWQKAYGGSLDEIGVDIVPAAGGYTFISQSTSADGDVTVNYGQSDIWIAHLDQSGNLLWQKTHGSSVAEYAANIPRASIVHTTDGGYIFHAYRWSLHTYATLILKLTPTGDQVWQSGFSGVGFMNGLGGDIIQTPDGGYIACGTGRGLSPYFPFPNIQLLRLNANGTTRWRASFGHHGDDIPSKLAIDSDGDIMVAGTYTAVSGTTLGNGNRGAWIFKIKDQPGAELVWSKIMGGTQADGFDDIAIGDSGELLIAGTTSSNDGDVTGARGQSDIWFVRMRGLNVIRGTVFIDNNLNGIRDAGDVNANNFLVRSEKNGSINESLTVDGKFENYADSGITTTTVILNNSHYNVVPALHQSMFTSYQYKDSIGFALQPAGNVRDYRISLIPLTPARPGLRATYRVHISNPGTEVLTGRTVSFIKERMTFVNASMPPAGISGDTIRWTIASLNRNDTVSITFSMQADAAPAVAIGNILLLKAAIDSAGDANSSDNLSVLRQHVTGSYEPNDKTENAGQNITREDVVSGKPLLYTIRFQNTGDDTAHTVVILDTLSDKLDWTSIETVSASHAYQFSKNGNALRWTFSNIRLPDIDGTPASQGFISYRIKPKATLVAGDIITNAATVYFDFDLPVRTNTKATYVTGGPPPSPQVSGLLSNYCSNQGIQKGKITNYPAIDQGISVSVTLDGIALPVAADSSFSFNVSTLSQGTHVLHVIFTNPAGADTFRMNIVVTSSVTPDVNISANITTVVNLVDPVVITASNASGGGTSPLYTFAKDGNFTNILQAESSNQMLNLPLNGLQAGDNWIYVRMKTSSPCYTSQFSVDSIRIKLQLPVPNQPVITGLATSYCSNEGAQKIRISNYPPQGIGITITVKLDGNTLPLAADSSFSFDVNTLAAGNHTIQVTYANAAGTKTTTANFDVNITVTPDVNLTASPGSVSGNQPVSVTAINAAGGGSSPRYTFARDREFIDVFRPEGVNNMLTIAPPFLAPGENKVYVKMKTSAICYTQQTAIDSITIMKTVSTRGLVDPDFPDQAISFSPNPFRSRLVIQGLRADKTYTVSLYNHQGRLTHKIRVTNSSTTILFVPGQSAGIYAVHIYDETKKRVIGAIEVLKR